MAIFVMYLSLTSKGVIISAKLISISFALDR